MRPSDPARATDPARGAPLHASWRVPLEPRALESRGAYPEKRRCRAQAPVVGTGAPATRRRLLGATLAGAATLASLPATTACTVTGTGGVPPRPTSSAASPIVLGVNFVLPRYDAAPAETLKPLFAAYMATHAGVRVQWGQFSEAGVVWASVSPQYLDLRPYLGSANFDPASLVPGWQGAFTDAAGHVRAVPYMYVPISTWYSRQSLAAVHVSRPAGGWDTASFGAACRLAAQRHRGELLVDPPQGGNYVGFPVWNSLIWPAVVRGFGGALHQGLRAVLTDRGAVRAFEYLAGLVQLEPAPASPQATKGPQPLRMGSLFAFWYAGEPITTFTDVEPHEKDWSVARFPRLPTDPLIPGIIRGAGIPKAYKHPEAAARFLLWLVSPAGQRVMTGLDYSGVRADAAANVAWQKHLPAGFDTGGFAYDPRHMFFMPAVLAGPFGEASGAIQAALQKPAAERATLLAALEARVNSELRAEQTSASATG